MKPNSGAASTLLKAFSVFFACTVFLLLDVVH